MTPPDKCPRCGAPKVPGCVYTFECTLAGEFGVESNRCLVNQRDQLAARVDLLNRVNETARKILCDALGIENQAGEEDILGAIGALRDRVKQLEEARTKAAANSLANMLYVEGLNRKIARLIAEGDDLRKVVARDYPRTEFCDAWDKAKEAKP